MTKQATMAWVGTFVPYSVLPTKGGEGDVRIRNEQLHTLGFAGEGIHAGAWERDEKKAQKKFQKRKIRT